MKLIIRAMLCIIIAALAAGPMAEGFYAKNHQDCSCCNGPSQMPAKCHKTTKVCLCNCQLLIQVFLPKSNALPKPIFAGFAVQGHDAAYIYLSTKDIFHPPRTC
jgi:hypothetical protein